MMESSKRKRTGLRETSAGDDSMVDSLEKYARGPLEYSTRNIKHKSLKKTLKETKVKIIESASQNVSTEILLDATPGFIEVEENDRVYKIKQQDIKHNVDMNTAKNAFDLQLPNFGPYSIDYSRNGRFLLFGGSKGHVAVMDCLRTSMGAELQLQEAIHDVHYLQNETLFAVAQNKYTYIYDYKGVEIHCLRNHERPYKLEFLPYHLLLTSVGHSGWIKWQDVSTGEYVAGYQTGHGPCRVLKKNPHNAVSHVGHSNGVVTLWSPSAGKSLVSMFCHKAPLTDLAIDREGKYMVTSGLDGFLKIWDLRKYTCLHAYKPDKPVTSVDISDRGLIAIGLGRSAQVLRNAFTQPTDVTYLKHTVGALNADLASGGGAVAATRALASSVSVRSVRFRPLEDVLCIGHSHGLCTVIVPGAGEPNYDSFESNPFINPKQRREGEIQSLLQKLSPDMIGLDSKFVATVDKDQKLLTAEQQELFHAANAKMLQPKEKHRMRGRNKISAKLRRKQKNVIDAQSLKMKEQLKEQREDREKAKKASREASQPTAKSRGTELVALKRFLKKQN